MKSIKEIVGRKFNDKVDAREKKIGAEVLAWHINARKEVAPEVFNEFFTKDFLKKLAEGDSQGARGYLVEKAKEKPTDTLALGGVRTNANPYRSQPASIYGKEGVEPGSDVVNTIFDHILPELDGVKDLLPLLDIDSEKQEVTLRADIDSYLGVTGKGDNEKVGFRQRDYERALQFLEAVVSESKKAAKDLKELGFSADRDFFFAAIDHTAGSLYGRIIEKRVNEQMGLHFRSFGGPDAIAVGADPAAVADAVAVKYRSVFALLQLIDTEKNYLPFIERYFTTRYLSISEEGVQLATTAKAQLEEDFTECTHTFKANKILSRMGEYRKLRKSIEEDGLTLREFDLLTGDSPAYGLLTSRTGESPY